MERSQRHHSEHRRAEYQRLRKKTKQEEFVEALHREIELSPRYMAAAVRRRSLLVPLLFSGSSGPLARTTHVTPMIKAFFKKLASSTANDSLAASLRRKRFRHFLAVVKQFDKTPITILDIGGWERFWEIQGFADTANRIILLNTKQVKTKHAGISSVVGDARNMGEFGDRSIDIVFSNSVIEHLETIDNQLKMANEVRRIGKMYFIQTPSYFFPLEPHFLFPMFHWFPVSIRTFLVQHLSLGYFEKQKTKEDADKLIREHRLLKKHEFQSLFPDAEIITEKFCGFTKSYIAIKVSGAG